MSISQKTLKFASFFIIQYEERIVDKKNIFFLYLTTEMRVPIEGKHVTSRGSNSLTSRGSNDSQNDLWLFHSFFYYYFKVGRFNDSWGVIKGLVEQNSRAASLGSVIQS